ncbi:hypothetical protein N9D33_02205, partial [Flavobacteriaceae bacterium]|nr:hypothetical protein [Flavobacteriaceae bacterium]
MKMDKVNYDDLNARQKENYNYHKVASALADYGYDSMRLNNDWEGADFIAVNGDDMIKVQLKGRLTADKKYLNKDLYIAFIEDGKVKLYKHDDIIPLMPESTLKSKSWAEEGA